MRGKEESTPFSVWVLVAAAVGQVAVAVAGSAVGAKAHGTQVQRHAPTAPVPGLLLGRFPGLD